MKNKKGFTLIELLVAISILGIIMIVAIPQLGNIQESNKKTKYKKYAESMLTSGKLYTDSYTEDMFGNNNSGCIDVSYSELKEKDLLKDIKIDETSCGGDDTFVQVLKTNDHYIYGVSVSCKDKNNNVVYEKKIPKCNGNGPDTTGPTIEITSNLSTGTWANGKDKTVTINISDSYGMLENTKINYYWKLDGELYGTKEPHNFKNKRYEGSSTEGKKLSYTVDIPQNKTGKFTFYVEPVDVRDANGNYQTTKATKGEFYLDNVPPTVPTVSAYKWVNNDDASKPTSTESLTTYTSNDWSNKNIYAVASNSTDVDSGEIYYQYTTTGKTENEENKTGTTRNIKAEGTSTIKFRACDTINNCSAYSEAISIKLDKTGPTCSVSGGNTSWTNSSRTITATCSETGGSGCKTSTFSKTYTSEINTTTAGAVGNNSGGSVEDNAGNITNCSANQTVKIDQTAPSINSVSNSSGGAWTKGNVVITATASDSGSGIAGTYYNYDNTTTTRYSDWNSGSTTSVSGTWSAERNNTVYIVSVDNAGNVAKISAGAVRIDKTAPTLSCYLNSPAVSVTINCDWPDDVVGIAYTNCYNDKAVSSTKGIFCHVKSINTRWSSTSYAAKPKQLAFSTQLVRNVVSMDFRAQVIDHVGNVSNVVNLRCDTNSCWGI